MVSDNGAGFAKAFDVEQCQSLGLKLVRVLARQLNGDIELHAEDKTEFIITFAA
jgi:two-component sensor histidine kinase